MRSNLIFLSILLVSVVSALPVGEIEITGSTFVSDSLVLRTLGLETGQSLRPVEVQHGVQNLYRLGYFSSIEILADSSSQNRVDILIQLSENNILSDWRLENRGSLKEDDVRENIMLLPGQTVSAADIEEARMIILEMYAEKHRHLATVDFRWEAPDYDGRQEIVFSCEEGPDIRVGEIDFTGNTVFDDGRLRGEMKTKQDSFWRSGRFRESDFREDLHKVELYYQNRGYPDARILDFKKSILEDGRHYFIEIAVNEGEFYEFGQVTFSGNQEVPDNILLDNVRIRTDQEYSISRVEESVDNIYIQLHDRGYFYASVEADINENDENRIDVNFLIEEGERAHIRRVEITGNTRTLDNVIRRELRLHPGDLFQRSSLMRSLRNVYYLNYFEDVIPDFRSIEGSSDIDLVIEVAEKGTGKAGIGAGYGEVDGMSGYLEFGEQNLFGRGQSVSVNYQFSSKRQDIQLSFREPWFRDTPLSLGGELFHTTSTRTEYDRKRTGGAITVGRPLPWIDYTSVSVRYLLEHVDVFDITSDSTSFYYSLRDEEWPRWTSALRFRILRDSRDRQVFPSEGSVNSLTAEFAGGILSGNIGYQKYLIDSSWYVPTFWKFIFSLRARAGFISRLGDDNVPAYELFELGGTGFFGVRGYGSRSIGAVEGMETVGGRSMIILTAEYRLRVIDQIQLSVFADAGNTWNSWRASNINDLNRGIGFGIRVEVPMLGIMGLDYAYGFDGPDKGWEPHFQFGTTF